MTKDELATYVRASWTQSAYGFSCRSDPDRNDRLSYHIYQDVGEKWKAYARVDGETFSGNFESTMSYTSPTGALQDVLGEWGEVIQYLVGSVHPKTVSRDLCEEMGEMVRGDWKHPRPSTWLCEWSDGLYKVIDVAGRPGCVARFRVSNQDGTAEATFSAEGETPTKALEMLLERWSDRITQLKGTIHPKEEKG